MSSTPAMPDRGADASRLQQLIDALDDHALLLLTPRGTIASWNRGAERLTGHGAPDVLGQSLALLFSDGDDRRSFVHQLLASARLAGGARTDAEAVRRDGSRFQAAITLTRLAEEAGRDAGFACVVTDCSRRLDDRAAQATRDAQFRLLVDGVTDYALFMLDPSGVVTSWNQGAERLKGYAADDIIGRHFSLFYTPEDRTRGLPARALAEAARTGRHESEGWRMRKDGSRFWALAVLDAIRDETGTLVGFAKITRDTSERRAAQAALAASERQLRLLIEGLSDHALIMLDPNGVVVSWNSGAQRIKGYTPDEIIGQHVSKFYTASDRAAGRPAMSLQRAREEGRFESEGWRVRKDGQLVWASVVVDAIRDEAGQLIGFAKITRDITERREAEAELHRTQQRLAQAQKMEALGQLTGGVAHDFNNLLTVIGGHLELLAPWAEGVPKARRSIGAIEQAAGRAAGLTRQLLTFARRQPLDPVAVDLGAHVQDMVDMLGNAVGPTVRLVLDIPADSWPVQVDAGELDLALLNLAVNARDAMPDGGELVIRAENVVLRPDDGSGSPDEPLDGDFVALALSDTGTGIPPDILSKVFDPFFTTKGPDKGTGLGLSQVYGFARHSGGAVTIRSEVGSGTTIILHLPRAGAFPERPAAEASAPVPAGRAVLVVEDDPEVAEVTMTMLAQLGYRPQLAAGPEAAIATLERGEPVDCLFSDVIMAGPMDGLALARAVRARAPRLPIVLATGYSGSAAAASDEFRILRKPYQLADLDRAIGTAIAAAAEPPEGTNTNLVRIDDRRRRRGPKPA